MAYTFRSNAARRSARFVAQHMPIEALTCVMTELLSIFPPWFFILLAVGVLDALLQFSDYREWRKEQRESGNVKE